MKSLLFFFFFIYAFFAFSQIDVKKVESLCFEFHNQERTKLSKPNREYSKTCENSANLQTSYLLKNFIEGQSLHDQLVKTNEKIYKTQEDRYNLFNKDSVKYPDSQKKTSLYRYDGEIALSARNLEMKLDSNTNEELAKNIIDWFKQSRGHNFTMLFKSSGNYTYRGAFSVKVNIKNTNNGYVTFDLYCVAVFDCSISLDLYDYKNKKWVQ